MRLRDVKIGMKVVIKFNKKVPYNSCYKEEGIPTVENYCDGDIVTITGIGYGYVIKVESVNDTGKFGYISYYHLQKIVVKDTITPVEKADNNLSANKNDFKVGDKVNLENNNYYIDLKIPQIAKVVDVYEKGCILEVSYNEFPNIKTNLSFPYSAFTKLKSDTEKVGVERIQTESYDSNGKLHSLVGAAKLSNTGEKEYYIHGVKMSKEQFDVFNTMFKIVETEESIPKADKKLPTLIYRHLRIYKDDEIVSRGGMTVGILLNYDTGTMTFYPAICHPDDNYCKATGIEMVNKNRKSDKSVSCYFNNTLTLEENIIADLYDTDNDTAFVNFSEQDIKIFKKTIEKIGNGEKY